MGVELHFIYGLDFSIKFVIFFAINAVGWIVCWTLAEVSRMFEKRLGIRSRAYLCARFGIEILIIVITLAFSFGIFDLRFTSLSVNITLIAILFAPPLRDFLVNIYGGFSVLIHRKMEIGSLINIWDYREVQGIVTEINMTNVVIDIGESKYAEIPNYLFISRIFYWCYDQERRLTCASMYHFAPKNMMQCENFGRKGLARNQQTETLYDKGYFIY